MPHTCHALACEKPVAPAMLMCARHWRMVPGLVRAGVYATYRPGQERSKKTSAAYRQAAARAVIAVAEQEEVSVPPIWRRMATGKEE